jgi:hypothetical protein
LSDRLEGEQNKLASGEPPCRFAANRLNHTNKISSTNSEEVASSFASGTDNTELIDSRYKWVRPVKSHADEKQKGGKSRWARDPHA